MSLHWTLIAGFLYVEVAVLLLLWLPFVPPRTWNRLFKSRFLQGLKNQLFIFFYILVAILLLFFLEAIREMTKYREGEDVAKSDHHHDLASQMQNHMRLFRAQRNFYIAGFALFMCLVIQRMVSLISSNASLEAEHEAAMKQAVSASRAAQSLIANSSDSDGAISASDAQLLKDNLKEKDDELRRAKKDLEAMKTQSENLASEYDRLMQEKDRLELRLRTAGGGDDDKKDD